jgi:serine/threonine-protein kinase
MATKETVARALALFDGYAEMGHAELSEALMRLQIEEPGVCTELMRLLAADEQTHTFPWPLRWFTASEDATAGRSGPQAADGRDTIWPDGTRLGPWRVEGILGLGGMGVVYAAQRADGLYEREVALKTIRAELMSPAMQEAFAKERRHLAKLDHPSIVALYDAGIADDGQPWLAMPRVHGEAIDRWCDAHRADLRPRVRMLAEACDAIAYAHAHGVLHQDIKPSNLLVTDDGKVKLLDFGLSALLGPQGEAGFVRIGVSSAYAAPEVFEGAPPSVAIDVYALGVVLYRMLCDGWPRKPRSLAAMPPGADDMPQSPSRLLRDASVGIARARGMRDTQALSRALRPDLDAIALRCVHRDPVARYASVADLCADLRAWLERRPVAASRGGWAYRAVRYVRRNAVPVAALTVLAFAAVVGGGMALQQRQRAQLEADNTEILSQLFEKSLGAATLSSLGSTPLSSKALLEDAERQLRRAAGERRPQFLARGLSVLARSYLVRADYAKAQRLLVESDALDSDSPLQRARNDAVLAQLLNARANTRKSEAVARAGLRRLPKRGGPEVVRARLDLQLQLALARYAAGESKDAVAILDEAVKNAESLGVAGAIPLAELLAKRGSLNHGSEPIEVVKRDFERAFSLIGKEDHAIRNRIGRQYVTVLQYSGHPEDAHRYASEALITSLDVFGPNHPETGRAWNTIGLTWYYRGDVRRTRIALRLSAAIIRGSVGRFHPDLGQSMLFESGLDFLAGDLPAALAKSREATAIYEHVFGPGHQETLRRFGDNANMLIMLGRYSAGEQRKAAYYREADALLSRIIRESERKRQTTTFFRDKHAAVQLYFGQIEAAQKNALAAVAEAERVYGAKSQLLGTARASLLQVRVAQGRCEDAQRLLGVLSPELMQEEERDFNDFLLLDYIYDTQIACGDKASARISYAALRRLAERKGLQDILDTLPKPETPPGRWRQR